MSALPVPHTSNPYRRLAAPRRHLRAVVGRTAQVSRLPFLLTLAGVLVVGLLGLALLNTKLQDQAFEMRSLHREQARLANREARLITEVEARSAPTALAAEASQLGMRPNTHAAFLVVPDGTVIGDPTAVSGDEMPEVVVRSTSKVSTAQQKSTEATTGGRVGKPVSEEEGGATEEGSDPESAEQPTNSDTSTPNEPQPPATQQQQPAPEPAPTTEKPAEKPAETPQERAEREAAEQQQRNETEAERAKEAATGGAG